MKFFEGKSSALDAGIQNKYMKNIEHSLLTEVLKIQREMCDFEAMTQRKEKNYHASELEQFEVEMYINLTEKKR